MSSRSIKDIPLALNETTESLDRLSYSFKSISRLFKEMKESAPEKEED
ncbi:MAG: hypothetical protein K6A34_06215 [Methanobrevibacter sp.]|nr:hypothetical protein [Methanobrevibacter sp.]